MASQNIKKINREDNAADTRRHNWEVLKPFVYFSLKAIAVIGSALIAIIKIILKATTQKGKKIIKI